MTRIYPAILAILALLACGRSDDTPAGEQAHLGYIEFTPTGSEQGQQHFREGLLLLHSFEYEDARKAFLKTQSVDSGFYMAYWGEAMTYNHPLWAARYEEEGKAALDRLGPTTEERLAKAPTPIERDFMEGVEILFSEGDKIENDKRYSEHMGEMFRTYPNNQEVSAFYALSLLGSAPERDTAVYSRGAQIAQSILTKNPEHPGALHYMIHSYDDPWRAHLALEAANNYSVVAPDAAHALHMPSHIYVALGMWDEVITSNIASYEASNQRRIRLDLDNDARSYHALHWLMYGRLQKAQFEEARTLLADMGKYAEELPSTRARAYLGSMRANYVVDAEAWDDPIAAKVLDDDDLNISLRAANHLISGLVAYHSGDVDALRNTANTMEAQRNEEYNKMMQRGSSMCSGVSWASQLPTEHDINRAHVMEMELKALLAASQGDDAEARKWFDEAVALEESTSFMFGPPVIAKPSTELYGEWLLKQGMYSEAAKQFENALKKAPGRLLSVKGLEASQSALSTI